MRVFSCKVLAVDTMQTESADEGSSADFTQRSRQRNSRKTSREPVPAPKKKQCLPKIAKTQKGKTSRKAVNHKMEKTPKTTDGCPGAGSRRNIWKELMDRAIEERDNRSKQNSEPLRTLRTPSLDNFLTEDEDSNGEDKA